MGRSTRPFAQIRNLYYTFVSILLHSITDTPCITEVHVQNRTDNSITFSWTVPAPRLSYSVLVCPEDSSRCLPRVTCTDCSSYEATGLPPSTDYTVTVDNFSLVSNGECVSKGCTSNTAIAQTGTHNALMGIPGV